MFLNWIIYIELFIGVLVLYFANTGWLSAYLLIMIVLLPVFSLVCNRISADKAEAVILQQGSWLVMRIESTKKQTLYGYADVTVRDLLAGEKEKKRVGLSRQDTSICECVHAGAYRVDVRRACLSDMVGLFQRRIAHPAHKEVIIYPEPLPPGEDPDYSSLQKRAWHPKPGGGFSEVHEIREYQPGDAMRSVHWKLSAKKDDLLIREAQEEDRRAAYLTYEKVYDRTVMDGILGELLYLSDALLAMDQPHFIYADRISDRTSQKEVFEKILRGEAERSTGKVPYDAWLYHVKGGNHNV
ncbi:MAG: DUF58 domain-containing protein [Solobacterium sp.]|nr:DUF58 domain-containing protein [Solobacterium sp.]